MGTQELADKLVLWLKERVKAAGRKGVVIGMSGGIDSSVLAALCRRACPQNILGVIMPCGSIEEDKEHALLVAKKFSIPTTEVMLDEMLSCLLKALPELESDPATSRVTQANLKSRLRMVTLYYVANQLQYLVIGSSNRSELAVGYFTKWGDGGVDIMPLGNLVKGQVRELARFLGVPEPIIAKPPSAGLWAGQTSEGELGFKYDDVDRYLLGGELPASLKQKIAAKVEANKHKRTLPPAPDF
jgi:NAD+ synthase